MSALGPIGTKIGDESSTEKGKLVNISTDAMKVVGSSAASSSKLVAGGKR